MPFPTAALSELPDTVAFDDLVPDRVVRQELHTSSMSIHRWDRDPRMVELGWPPPGYICGRNHRSRRQLEIFKANLLKRAIETRARLLETAE